jgi:hypothetical protein
MGFLSSLFGPSFGTIRDKFVYALAPAVANDAERVCRGLVSVYNDDVRQGLRGRGREPVGVSDAALLGYSIANLIPFFSAFAAKHQDRRADIIDATLEVTRVLNAKYLDAARAYSGDEFSPYKGLTLAVMLGGTGIAPEDAVAKNIILSYKLSLGKLEGRSSDVADLISRFEDYGTLSTNAYHGLRAAGEMFPNASQ